jgi:hypothetical protein
MISNQYIHLIKKYEKKYDLAFAPLNERLLILSFNISKLLIKKGFSTCILKTSLIGSKLSAFKNKSLVKKISDEIPIVDLPFVQFKNRVGFFRNILRIIMVHQQLNTQWKAPYNILVTYMDDYSIDEVLTIYSKKKNIPTIMLQEGSEPRKSKYNFSFYDFFYFLRNLMFKNYFHFKSVGLNSDYVAAWSKLNYQNFIKSGRTSKNTFLVGSPYPLKKFKKKNKKKKNILILHQTLYHRYSSITWNDELWINLALELLKNNYNVTLKPHPRADTKKEVNLFNYIKKKANLINKPIKIIKRNILAENLINDTDLVITCNSVGANKALGNGLPVIYIDTPYNKNEILHKLKRANDIILVTNWIEAINKINLLFKSSKELIKWKKKGYSSLVKLAGDPKIFKSKWIKLISKVLNEKK